MSWTPSEPNDDDEQSHGKSSVEGIVAILGNDSTTPDTFVSQINQQLESQLFRQKGDPATARQQTPATAWHSQSMRTAKMARPEVAKAIYDADQLVGIPAEMHFKFIAGIENPTLNPNLGIVKGGKGISQVVDTTARQVITDILPKTPWGRQVLEKMPELQTSYNPYDAKMGAVVSASYIRHIAEERLHIKPDANGKITFKSPEELTRATVDTYINYNVGPGDGKKILNAYYGGNANASVDNIGLAPISITNNPSLYSNNRTVGQAYEGIRQKLNINVQPLIHLAKNEPQTTIASMDVSKNGVATSVNTLNTLNDLRRFTSDNVYASWARNPISITNAQSPDGGMKVGEAGPAPGSVMKPKVKDAYAQTGAFMPGMRGPLGPTPDAFG